MGCLSRTHEGMLGGLLLVRRLGMGEESVGQRIE